jgi:hypothetical protein
LRCFSWPKVSIRVAEEENHEKIAKTLSDRRQCVPRSLNERNAADESEALSQRSGLMRKAFSTVGVAFARDGVDDKNVT